ncbi:UNVERIFIED_CONTAM: hypothetical protein FKN15_033306 [Acipenser sinensis]
MVVAASFSRDKPDQLLTLDYTLGRRKSWLLRLLKPSPSAAEMVRRFCSSSALIPYGFSPDLRCIIRTLLFMTLHCTKKKKKMKKKKKKKKKKNHPNSAETVKGSGQ